MDALSQKEMFLCNRRKIVGAIVGAPFAGSTATACVEPPSPRALAGLRAAAGSPGLGVGKVCQGQRTILVSGVRMRGRRTPVEVSDLWHWGSVTKSITATLAARLVESGAIRWDTTAIAALGLDPREVHEGFRATTLLQLLSHCGGVGAYSPDWELLRFPRHENDPRESRLAVARSTLSRAAQGRAGFDFIYANRGYIIVGAMLEAALGAPWETLIARFVFTPLEMRTAGFGAPGRVGRIEQPVGHASWFLHSRTPHPPGSAITDNPAVWGPAGRVHSSLADMMRFLEAHRDQSSLLSRDTWRTLHTPAFGGAYGLGWYLSSRGTFSHTGSNTLWSALVQVDRSKSVCTAVVCNDGSVDFESPSLSPIMRVILE